MKVSGHTRVLALIGHPVAHSRSPALHNGWLRAAGIDAVYVALPTADADPAALVRGGLWGANVTVPLKRRCTPDRLEPDAAATGAVNTLYWDGPTLVGANTDVEGFRRSTEAAIGPLAGRRAVVLGAGGAARAVVRALQQAGTASIAVANRSPADVGVPYRPLEPRAVADADLVINALPGGARAQVEALDLPATGAWVDLNYWDDAPPQRDAAQRAGLQWVDGHGMLEAQAALSFEKWTGRPPPR